ncbi:hypothetical protein BX666DRAFT_1852521 [Dichotomocladium elegans]|nr:hypothetical protein BX666DRAFT_1852521 [Dichotomocladium elegans]
MVGTAKRTSLFMSGQTRKDLNELFGNLDKDKEGHIAISQLEPVLISTGINTEAVVQMLNKKSADDRVSFAEFTTLFASHSQSLKSILAHSHPNKKHHELKEAFDAFDNDRDGAIDAVELQKMMLHLGEKVSIDECKAMIAEADSDGDGVVNYDDFLVMMGVRPKKKKIIPGPHNSLASRRKSWSLKRLFTRRST